MEAQLLDNPRGIDQEIHRSACALDDFLLTEQSKTAAGQVIAAALAELVDLAGAREAALVRLLVDVAAELESMVAAGPLNAGHRLLDADFWRLKLRVDAAAAGSTDIERRG